MKKENLINNYLCNDYEMSYQTNSNKNEILSIIQDGLLKLDFYLSKFSTEDFGIKLIKEKLSSFNGEEKFINLFSSIYDSIESILIEYTNMIKKISNSIKEMKPSFDPYFKKFYKFTSTKSKFSNYLNNIEFARMNFLEASKNAELYTYDFIKKKLNNSNANKDKEFKHKEDLRNLAKLKLEIYSEKITKGKRELRSFNEKQKEFFKDEKELEKEYDNCYSNCLQSYFNCIFMILGNVNNLNDKLMKLCENSIKKKEDYFKNYKQKDNIEFEQYKTNIEFDKCKNIIELSACLMVYNELASNIGMYQEIEKLDDKKILEECIEIDRILNLNDKITDKDYGKLVEILKDDLGKNILLGVFDLMISSGKHEKSENFINIIRKILEVLLEFAEKENNYETSKKCINISETFYYLDSKQEKKYVYELIKDNKWLKGSKFWRGFINAIFKQEFEKLNELEKEVKEKEKEKEEKEKKEKEKKEKEKKGKGKDKKEKEKEEKEKEKKEKEKKEINASLIKLLLFYINIMKKYKIDARIIIKIFDEISEKYNNWSKESYYTLFAAISQDIKEIEEYRKGYQENPDLEKQLYNYEDEEEKENNIDNNNQIIDEK